ncbi:endo-1,4-beta-xylanase [Streptomyces coeruleorubidus]|uniref:endo-1,4-beta-xylanase n=1 Tax=Streptomyces coeruleorubidus TaxID=116188 RepID=UPI0033D53020
MERHQVTVRRAKLLGTQSTTSKSRNSKSSARSRTARRRVFSRIGAFAITAVLTLVAGAHTPAAAAGVPVLSLREKAAESGVLIGSGAVNPAYLDDPQFAKVLPEQFGSLSPENELKWSWVQPEEGTFNFTKLDRLVDFAEEHDMAVKGHGLISGCCNPPWLEQITDPDELRAAMTTHFRTIMTRYAGKMDRWDVATEVLSTFGGTGLSENYFYRVLGPDYLAEAFRIAHAANPNAKLFINESLVESYPEKRQELYDLVSDLVARGVPIDGVGLEMHVTLAAPDPGVITEMVHSYKALGLEVAITEMDVHLYPGERHDVDQAQIYWSVVTEALAAGVRDISFWGFTDKYAYTWLPGAKPLMFDENYKPKPAYFATWAALAIHSAASGGKGAGSVGDIARTLVTAGAVDARDAPELTSMLKSAAQQLEGGKRNVRGAVSELQWDQVRAGPGRP